MTDIDTNIDFNRIVNKHTVVINMKLTTTVNTFVIDLYNDHCLKFQPDVIRPKYITYTSQNNGPSNVNPIILVDFLIDNRYLVPFNARTSIQSFGSLELKTQPHKNYSKTKFEVVGLSDIEEDVAYKSGTILLCVEFVRYARRDNI